MINILKLTAENVYAVGDLHGNFNMIIPNLKNRGIENAVIVFCGDVGIGFRRKEYYEELFAKISKSLVESNNRVVFFRGNHDNPKYYDGKHFLGDTYQNIYVVPDYTILNINGGIHNILCIGGAISVDRSYRKEWNNMAALSHETYHIETKDRYIPQCYWEDEVVVHSKCKINKLTEEDIKINTICAHTAPLFAFPAIKGDFVEQWAKRDPFLLEDLDAERKIMSSILEDLLEREHPITKWVYGHFHNHEEEDINGIKFILLNQCSSNKLDVFKL